MHDCPLIQFDLALVLIPSLLLGTSIGELHLMNKIAIRLASGTSWSTAVFLAVSFVCGSICYCMAPIGATLQAVSSAL